MKAIEIVKIIGILLLFLIVQQFGGALIGAVSYMLNSGFFQTVMENPEKAHDQAWILSQIDMDEYFVHTCGIGYAVSSVACVLLMRLSRLTHAGIHRTTWQAIVWGLLLALPACVLSNVVTEWVQLEDIMGEQFTKAMNTAWGAVSISVLGPIAEEVCFRAGIFGVFIKKARESGDQRWLGLGLFLQAVLFGVFHLNPAQVMFATIMGLLFGWVYYATGSIWPCIAMHVLNNSSAVLMARYMPDVNSFTDVFGGVTPTVCVCLVCVWMIWVLLTRMRYIAPDE